MSKHLFVLIILLFGFCAHADLAVSGGPGTCLTVLDEIPFVDESKTEKSRWIDYSTHVTGVIIGSTNDVVISATRGGLELLAPGISKWLPLLNEIANVVSTSTGREWIYSGVQKKMIDGIALGAIAGQSIRAGIESGPIAGALTFGVTFGLTYWFPNHYFHKIMKAIPGLASSKYRKILNHPVGQGFIGISMIVLLEQILEHSQHLARVLPSLFSYNEPRENIKEFNTHKVLVCGIPRSNLFDLI